MKAAVYYETGAPSVFKYEEVPDPVVNPGSVLVDVKAISIEGGDVLNRAGGEMPAKPHIVGYQCAGIVREVGSQSHGPQRGAGGRCRNAVRLPCGNRRRRRTADVSGARRSRPPAGRLRPHRLRHRPRVPLRVRAPPDRRERPHPGGRGRRRARRHPAREARRRDRPRDRIERRKARASQGVRPRPRHQLPQRRLGLAGAQPQRWHGRQPGRRFGRHDTRRKHRGDRLQRSHRRGRQRRPRGGPRRRSRPS